MKFSTLMLALTFSAVAAAAQAQPVSLIESTPGPAYFNKPGTNLSIHNRDLTGCLVALNSVAGRDISQGMVGNTLTAITANRRIAHNVENCMVVRGWRVVQLSGPDAAVASLGSDAMRQWLAEQVGAQQPIGNLTRWWGNDAARASNDRFGVGGRLQSTSLSLAALDGPIDFQRAPLDRHLVKPSKSGLSLEPGQAGLVLVLVKGTGFHSGSGLLFTRQPDSAAESSQPTLNTLAGHASRMSDGKMYAYRVPPGRWRLAGMTGASWLEFCLGAPTFTVGSGEVVYAGAFDLSSEALAPDLTMAPAQAFLADQSGLATRLRPASYTNGVVDRCSVGDAYALEFPGAPFEPNYGWGSLAVHTPLSDLNGE